MHLSLALTITGQARCYKLLAKVRRRGMEPGGGRKRRFIRPTRDSSLGEHTMKASPAVDVREGSAPDSPRDLTHLAAGRGGMVPLDGKVPPRGRSELR
jgi:hypothetical protein